MTPEPEPELSDAQREVVAELPGTVPQIAETLGLSNSAVRGRLNRIDQHFIYRDSDDLWVWDGPKDLHRMKTAHTGSVTRRANNFLTDDEAGIKALLNNTEPATAAQDPNPDNEDLVIPISDLHFGDHETDDKDRDTYNVEIAKERTEAIIENAITEARKQPAEFDTCHLLLNGDIVTGEGIYDAQWENQDTIIRPNGTGEEGDPLYQKIKATLKYQINLASEVLMGAIKRLSEEFDVVQVICQPGNHGENRASGVSKQANADIHVYSRLEFGVRMADIDNVQFVFHDSTKYTNFTCRGGKIRGMLRHGEECQEHAGATSASKRDWRGWLDMHVFDFAVRGHFHVAKVERVLGRPVFMAGSPAPAGDFEESISEWDQPGAMIFGVSDEQVPTWVKFIDF